MNTQKFFLKGIFLILGILFILALVQNAYAFQVAALSGDNLIQNPWFRDASEPSLPGFDNWVNVNNDWTLSQKISNPSMNAFISGKCNSSTPTYCGTSAKLSADDGNGQVGVDSYLYQIVSADPTHAKLKFSTHWVTHFVDPFEVNIYGGANANGPWTLVWTPIDQQILTMLIPPPGYDTSWLWMEMTSWTPPVEMILPNGYPYYRVEIRVNIPSPEGFKITGVYFASEHVNGPPQTLTAMPTGTPTPTQTPSKTPSLTFTATPNLTMVPTLTGTLPPIPTNTPTSNPLDIVFVSSTTKGIVGGITFEDEDIVSYQVGTGTWTMTFDGSDVGVTADLDAFDLLADGNILMSFDIPTVIGSLGYVDDSDIVRFTPTSLGSTTTGTFTWYFDGSDVKLSTNDEDIDAVDVLSDGTLVIGVTGNFASSPVSGVDEDLFQFTPTQLGTTTAGTWTFYFDGSDVGLSESANEGITAALIDPFNGNIYLTVLGPFSVPGVSGDGSDIFMCIPGSLGQTTSCIYALYWDGSTLGFAGEVVDAFHIQKNPANAPK